VFGDRARHEAGVSMKIAFIRKLARRRELDAEIEEELRSHLELRIQRNIESGMSPEKARLAARLNFGGMESAREECREAQRPVWVEQIAREARIGARVLWRSPGFAFVAILTLALGIGATTAVFTVANGLLLKPLPWPDSHRVMSVWEGKENNPQSQTPMAPAQFIDLARQAKSFKALAGWNSTGINFVPANGAPQRLQGAAVTAAFFEVVQIQPQLGSGFTEENFRAGKDSVVVIGQSIWRDQFAGASNIIGQVVRINGRMRTIVGVMPPGFQTPAKSQFWTPRIFSEFEQEDRNLKVLPALGRLADGVSERQAAAELSTLFAALRKQYPDFLDGWTVRIHPALEDSARLARPALLVLMAAVSTALLMACVNVANLLLARGARRMGELSVRAALGASRSRLMRQLLIENLVLAFFGGALGLLFAKGLLVWLLAAAPASLPRIDQVHMDWRTLLFAMLVCGFAGLIFGAAPAWRLSQRNPARDLRDLGQRSTASVGWLRRGLAGFQVAASVVVLLATTLLIRSFDRLLRQDLGFNPENLMTARVELPPAKYAAEHRREQFAEETLRELRGTVGVESAAVMTYLPLQGGAQFIMRLENNPNIKVSEAPAVSYQGVSDDFVRTMGMRLILGRDLLTTDTAETPRVCLVNETFVRRYFPAGPAAAIGCRLEVGFSEPPQWSEIVGVVNDARNVALEAEPVEQVLAPLAQQDDFLRGNPTLTLVVRTRSASNAAKILQRAVWQIDKEQPLHLLRPMNEVLVDARAQRRFTSIVMAVFGVAAGLLATIGLFGVISGDVAARTREFGVRLALGALPGEVTRLALRSGVLTLSAGLGFGIFAALFSARLIRTMLYHTEVLDAVCWAGVCGGLIVTGLASSYWPARRAGKVDPIVALRQE
jgi:predicted permease